MSYDHDQPRRHDWSNSVATQVGDEYHPELKTQPTQPDVNHFEHVPLSGPNGTNDSTLSKTSSQLQRTRQALGLHPIAPIDEEHDMADYSDLWWSKVRLALREPFAEFFGTFILVLFGDGAVAQVLLSAGETSAPGMSGFGSYQSINWG